MTDFDPYSEKIADVCALIRQHSKCEAWELFKNAENGLEVLCSIVDAVREDAKAAVPVINQAQLFAIANGLISEVDEGEEDDDDKSNTVRGIAWMHSEVVKAMAATQPSKKEE